MRSDGIGYLLKINENERRDQRDCFHSLFFLLPAIVYKTPCRLLLGIIVLPFK